MEQKNEKQDSFTIGTPSKGGSSKVYYDLSTQSEAEVDKLVKQAIKVWQLSNQLTQ